MVLFRTVVEEIILGGSSAGLTCIFTNPLEVVKTRMQLQGELKSKGTYVVYYRNFFHAFYSIGKSDGILTLQSGLITGICYQAVMNGARLGSYQIMASKKFHLNEDGSVSYYKAFIMGASSGVLGAFLGSPLYMVKTHMQAHSDSNIAVGYQRKKQTMVQALKLIFNEYGIRGLWRGWQAQIIRVMTGSAIQLSTFSKFKSLIDKYELAEMNSLSNAFLASAVSAIAVTVVMAPFDVLSTRIYNQPLDPKTGRGLYYAGLSDAFVKVYLSEGLTGLYKGASAVFFRLSPHTVINLLVWDRLRQTTNKLLKRNKEGFSTA